MGKNILAISYVKIKNPKNTSQFVKICSKKFFLVNTTYLISKIINNKIANKCRYKNNSTRMKCWYIFPKNISKAYIITLRILIFFINLSHLKLFISSIYIYNVKAWYPLAIKTVLIWFSNTLSKEFHFQKINSAVLNNLKWIWGTN